MAQPAAAETAKIAASETVAQANGNGVFQLTDLVVEVLQEGNGTTGRVGQTMVVEFTSWIMEGGQPTREFDSTSARGGPFSFVLGRNQAIKGWDVGLKGMRVGSRLRLTVPPNMAYGERGFAGPSAFVPPGAWVMSEVTLLEVR
ncbi:MAG: FKBP-type peptidyl-prolyl cis-trans isomerase [Alphaproteobacteria bacterium]|nr:FKBP-type peptidyl-prolyl cis-trans isomerase [Alphaproteobacteria bacterium]